MTEFEMAEIANELRTLIAGYGSTIMSVVSAFLVASYVAAHYLHRIMAGFVIFVFSYWYVEAFRITFTLMQEAQGLRAEIAKFAHDGRGLAWHAFATPPNQNIQSVEMVAGLAVMVIAYCGSLAFFFHCRRVNRKPEAPASQADTGA